MFLSIKKADFKKVTNIWNDGFSDYILPINMTEKQLAHRINSLDLSKDSSCVLVKDGEYAGILLLGTKSFQGRQIMWIGGMAISPKYRGLRLSNELMTYAIQQAKKEACDSLNLEVITSNKKAKALYQNFGFKKVNELTNGFWQVNEQNSTDFSLVEITDKELTEPSTTPWQNQLSVLSQVKGIIFKGERIGHLGYQESVDKISIQQLIIYKDDNLHKLDNLLPFLSHVFKKKIYFSNLATNSQEFQAITQFNPITSVNQYQMTLKI